MRQPRSTGAGSETLEEVLQQFCPVPGDAVAAPVGNGNINETYLVTGSADKFILQRLSGSVFPEPLHVITNFQKIGAHLQQKTAVIAPGWQFSRIVYTAQGDSFYRDGRGDMWRGQTCLDHKPVKLPVDRRQAREVGRALGCFHLLISDMDCTDLHDPLPGFHILPQYLAQFDSVRLNKYSREENLAYCLAAVERQREKAVILEQARERGILVVQPVHGDPKIDNFVFDVDGNAVGLIDMDTVSPGLLHYDIGDCVRSCCNRGGEGGSADVLFDMELCNALLEGYLHGAGVLLSPAARSYIFEAVLLLTFELGLRFFTDHLLGDNYFKVSARGENLQRAVVQFRLVEEIEKYEMQIRAAANV
jgi:hypothetical protein